MAYRFTNTDKWNDSWFLNLKPLEKLLFIYLCDNCDIAGFIEVNLRRWATDIDTNIRGIEGALKGLKRGLIFSHESDCIYIKNFLKHQKNYPLNEKNKAHLGIISRFEKYLYKFDYQNYNDFIERAFKGGSKGDKRGTGNGIGIGIGILSNTTEDDNIVKGGMGGKIKTWREDFEIYKTELFFELQNILNDQEYISKQQRYNPNLDIRLSIQKSFEDYWNTESGWENKKKSKSENLNWRLTFQKTLQNSKVYKQNGTNKKFTSKRGEVYQLAAEAAADLQNRIAGS